MKFVGILNITPDSFSNESLLNSEKKVLNQTHQLIEDGADIIDIGAESTNPRSSAISHEEEWSRLSKILPQIIKICQTHNVQTSLDSYKPETISKAIDCGINQINDVTGLQNPKMLEIAKNFSGKIVLMHSLSIPASRNITFPENEDPVKLLKSWLEEKLNTLQKNNINPNKIIFDPGIGFGKTADQSIEIIKRISEFKKFNLPIYIGHSRKSFFSNLTNVPFKDRDLETSIVTCFLATHDINYLRVHNVAFNKRALTIFNEFFKTGNEHG